MNKVLLENMIMKLINCFYSIMNSELITGCARIFIGAAAIHVVFSVVTIEGNEIILKMWEIIMLLWIFKPTLNYVRRSIRMLNYSCKKGKDKKECDEE